MPGGWLHWPLWVPYELYGTVDYVYGFPHFTAKEGWGPTQGFGNAIETSLYFLYLFFAFKYGRKEEVAGRGAPANALSFGRRKIVGREAGVAVLIGLTTAVMTFWKTFLYCQCKLSVDAEGNILTRVPGFIEFFNGYQNIGHNDVQSLILLWIIPK
jgi:hypothetical protein